FRSRFKSRKYIVPANPTSTADRYPVHRKVCLPRRAHLRVHALQARSQTSSLTKKEGDGEGTIALEEGLGLSRCPLVIGVVVLAHVGIEGADPGLLDLGQGVADLAGLRGVQPEQAG